MNSQIRNFFIALTAIVLSVLLFLGVSSKSARPSLTQLAETATPYEVAMTNHKPTLVEFYANWCTSCQAMVGDMDDLRHQYGDAVNFVMLNVDNPKWMAEVLRYEVDGIPEFVFFNQEAEDVAIAIGEQPRSIMERNLGALIAQAPLPYVAQTGSTSTLETDALSPPVSGTDDPRGHGGAPARS